MGELTLSNESIEKLLHHVGDATLGLYRDTPGFEAFFAAEAWWVVSGIDFPVCNWMVFTRETDRKDGLVRSYVSLLRERSLSGLICFPSIEHDPGALCEELGLYPPGSLPLMVLEGDALARIEPHPGVEAIGDAAALDEARLPIALAFEAPVDGLRSIIADEVLLETGVSIHVIRHDGVGRSAVVTHRSGTTVYVHVMATDPNYQRRGLGRALLETVIAKERDAGATRFHLLASSDGFPLYRKIGFEVAAPCVTRLVGHETRG